MLAVGVLPGMLQIASGIALTFGVGQLIVLLPGLFPGAQRCSAFSFSYSLVVAVLNGTSSDGPAIACPWFRSCGVGALSAWSGVSVPRRSRPQRSRGAEASRARPVGAQLCRQRAGSRLNIAKA